jgi:hypothetical protein
METIYFGAFCFMSMILGQFVWLMIRKIRALPSKKDRLLALENFMNEIDQNVAILESHLRAEIEGISESISDLHELINAILDDLDEKKFIPPKMNMIESLSPTSLPPRRRPGPKPRSEQIKNPTL